MFKYKYFFNLGCYSTERTRVIKFKKKGTNFRSPALETWGGGEGSGRTCYSTVALLTGLPFRRGFPVMCECVFVSTCDSKFDNVLLLLACSVYDDDHNPPDGHTDNPHLVPMIATRSVSIRLRLLDQMEGSLFLLHAIYCLKVIQRKSPYNARSKWPIHSRPDITRGELSRRPWHWIGTIRIFQTRLQAVDNE